MCILLESNLVLAYGRLTATHRRSSPRQCAPPTWTEKDLAPARERTRLGPAQRDITVRTRVRADDGEVGRVDQVEFDPETGT
jgi:hypothetical protein